MVIACYLRFKKSRGKQRWRDDGMPWSASPVMLYHGTVGPHAADIVQGGIRLAICLPNSDFGKGFYTTRILDQAKRFANSRYSELHDDFVNARSPLDPECAAIVAFQVDLDRLAAVDTLAFVQPTPDWRAFVSYCRLPSPGHKPAGNFYGAVYGPVFAVAASPSAPFVVPDWEQISFHTDSGISVLQNPQVSRGGPTI